MDKKKILYLDFTLPYLYSDLDEYPGGAAVEWLHWIKGFNKINLKVGVLTYKGIRKYIKKKLDFDLIECWDEKKGIRKLRLFYYTLPTFYKTIKNYNPDYLVQETAGRYTAYMAIIAKLLRKKFIYRVASDQEVDNRLKTYLTKTDFFLFNIGLKFADFILCQNKYQEKRLRERLPKKKIFLIYNPFNIVNNEKTFEKRNRTFIAWVGSFTYLKNLPALLEIIKKHPTLKFKIAGKPNKYQTDSETNIAIGELKKLDNVEFVGLLKNEEITNFLKNAYALMNTSRLEGFSNTFIEAWSVGTPVISTNSVNPDNIISDKGLGIIVDSYINLSSAIEKIITLPEGEFHLISNRCKDYVKEMHDAEVLAKRFMKIIEN